MRDYYDALVVGAGPVGLFAALSLAKRDLSVCLVDEGWQSPSSTPTVLLHSRTLELLEEVGVLDSLMDQGRVIERLSFFDGERRAASLELASLARRFPFVLAVPHRVFQAKLLSALEDVGVTPRRKCGVVQLSQDEREVAVNLVQRDFVPLDAPRPSIEWTETEKLCTRAAFVIGADGYYSKVRSELGIDWIDLQQTESFALCEFDSVRDLGHELSVIVGSEHLSSLCPLPFGGRLTLQTSRNLAESLTEHAVRELVRERAPWLESTMSGVQWATLTHFERLLVSRFGQGHVWLAGDAAHVTSPFGMQSVNAGLFEAFELARYMADVRSGVARDEVFRVFEMQRQAEWRSLLGVDLELHASPSADRTIARNAARLVPCIPAAGADLRTLLGELGLYFTEPVRECSG